MANDKQEMHDDFYDKVNMMMSTELEDGLQTEKSKSISKDSGDGGSICCKSGRNRYNQAYEKT